MKQNRPSIVRSMIDGARKPPTKQLEDDHHGVGSLTGQTVEIEDQDPNMSVMRASPSNKKKEEAGHRRTFSRGDTVSEVYGQGDDALQDQFLTKKPLEIAPQHVNSGVEEDSEDIPITIIPGVLDTYSNTELWGDTPSRHAHRVSDAATPSPFAQPGPSGDSNIQGNSNQQSGTYVFRTTPRNSISQQQQQQVHTPQGPVDVVRLTDLTPVVVAKNSSGTYSAPSPLDVPNSSSRRAQRWQRAHTLASQMKQSEETEPVSDVEDENTNKDQLLLPSNTFDYKKQYDTMKDQKQYDNDTSKQYGTALKDQSIRTNYDGAQDTREELEYPLDDERDGVTPARIVSCNDIQALEKNRLQVEFHDQRKRFASPFVTSNRVTPKRASVHTRSVESDDEATAIFSPSFTPSFKSGRSPRSSIRSTKSAFLHDVAPIAATVERENTHAEESVTVLHYTPNPRVIEEDQGEVFVSWSDNPLPFLDLIDWCGRVPADEPQPSQFVEEDRDIVEYTPNPVHMHRWEQIEYWRNYIHQMNKKKLEIQYGVHDDDDQNNQHSDDNNIKVNNDMTHDHDYNYDYDDTIPPPPPLPYVYDDDDIVAVNTTDVVTSTDDTNNPTDEDDINGLPHHHQQLAFDDIIPPPPPLYQDLDINTAERNNSVSTQTDDLEEHVINPTNHNEYNGTIASSTIAPPPPPPPLQSSPSKPVITHLLPEPRTPPQQLRSSSSNSHHHNDHHMNMTAMQTTDATLVFLIPNSGTTAASCNTTPESTHPNVVHHSHHHHRQEADKAQRAIARTPITRTNSDTTHNTNPPPHHHTDAAQNIQNSNQVVVLLQHNGTTKQYRSGRFLIIDPSRSGSTTEINQYSGNISSTGISAYPQCNQYMALLRVVDDDEDGFAQHQHPLTELSASAPSFSVSQCKLPPQPIHTITPKYGKPHYTSLKYATSEAPLLTASQHHCNVQELKSTLSERRDLGKRQHMHDFISTPLTPFTSRQRLQFSDKIMGPTLEQPSVPTQQHALYPPTMELPAIPVADPNAIITGNAPICPPILTAVPLAHLNLTPNALLDNLVPQLTPALHIHFQDDASTSGRTSSTSVPAGDHLNLLPPHHILQTGEIQITDDTLSINTDQHDENVADNIITSSNKKDTKVTKEQCSTSTADKREERFFESPASTIIQEPLSSPPVVPATALLDFEQQPPTIQKQKSMDYFESSAIPATAVYLTSSSCSSNLSSRKDDKKQQKESIAGVIKNKQNEPTPVAAARGRHQEDSKDDQAMDAAKSDQLLQQDRIQQQHMMMSRNPIPLMQPTLYSTLTHLQPPSSPHIQQQHIQLMTHQVQHHPLLQPSLMVPIPATITSAIPTIISSIKPIPQITASCTMLSPDTPSTPSSTSSTVGKLDQMHSKTVHLAKALRCSAAYPPKNSFITPHPQHQEQQQPLQQQLQPQQQVILPPPVIPLAVSSPHLIQQQQQHVTTTTTTINHLLSPVTTGFLYNGDHGYSSAGYLSQLKGSFPQQPSSFDHGSIEPPTTTNPATTTSSATTCTNATNPSAMNNANTDFMAASRSFEFPTNILSMPVHRSYSYDACSSTSEWDPQTSTNTTTQSGRFTVTDVELIPPKEQDTCETGLTHLLNSTVSNDDTQASTVKESSEENIEVEQDFSASSLANCPSLTINELDEVQSNETSSSENISSDTKADSKGTNSNMTISITSPASTSITTTTTTNTATTTNNNTTANANPDTPTTIASTGPSTPATSTTTNNSKRTLFVTIDSPTSTEKEQSTIVHQDPVNGTGVPTVPTPPLTQRKRLMPSKQQQSLEVPSMMNSGHTGVFQTPRTYSPANNDSFSFWSLGTAPFTNKKTKKLLRSMPLFALPLGRHTKPKMYGQQPPRIDSPHTSMQVQPSPRCKLLHVSPPESVQTSPSFYDAALSAATQPSNRMEIPMSYLMQQYKNVKHSRRYNYSKRAKPGMSNDSNNHASQGSSNGESNDKNDNDNNETAKTDIVKSDTPNDHNNDTK